MGSHEYVYLALGQTVEYVGASSSFDHSGEQFYVYIHISQHLADGRQVLLCQYLCGRHDARLVAVAYGYEHGHERHQRLARAHVSLQEPVHLLPGHQVRAYLLDDPLLGTGEPVGKGVVAGVEVWPHLWHKYTLVGAGAYVLLLEQAELKQEEFFELEAAGGLLKRVGV